MWETPITDRTLQDAEELVALEKAITSVGWDNASQEDKDLWLELSNKGAWNISDANRILENIEYLRDQISAQAITVQHIYQDLFSLSDLPYFTDWLNTMRENIYFLRAAYYELNHPEIPVANYPDYIWANLLEENLLLTKMLVERFEDRYKRYAGTFSAGEEFTL